MHLPDYIRTLPLVVVYTFTIYVFLVFCFRFASRRQLGQLTVVDLVVIIALGSAVETSMIGGNISLPGGLVSAGTLLVANRLFNLLSCRYKWVRRMVSGGPLLLVHNGVIVEERLRRSGFTKANLAAALRSRGCAEIADVRFAVLEEDGTINVVLKHTPTYRSDTLPSEAERKSRAAKPETS